MFYRGEIYYIEPHQKSGSEQSSGRPAIIVSNDLNNKHSSVVEVVFLTTQPKTDLPTHVSIRSSTKTSTALCEQVHSISVERIGNYIASCTDNEMLMIDAALAISLNLTPPQKSEKEIIEEKKAPVFQFDPALITKLETERDIYKKLYEQLLEKMI